MTTTTTTHQTTQTNEHGIAFYFKNFADGLTPDVDMLMSEWADKFMVIPPPSKEAGPMKLSRTPYAREPLDCLSARHPCRRVILQVGSQLFKTQAAIAFAMGCIAMTPSNIMVLLPSDRLVRRVSPRFDKTIDAIPEVRERVAEYRSRSAQRTIDTKSFKGGNLMLSTANSASALSEVSVRFLIGDELSRWPIDIKSEGDPVALAETRLSAYSSAGAKILYTSSPTITGECRINKFFLESDQRHFYIPCPSCQEHVLLTWPQMRWNDDLTDIYHICPSCTAPIYEKDKESFLAQGKWVAHAQGDGFNVGFTLNALYASRGFISWPDLVRQFIVAQKAMEQQDTRPMQVFYNVRLALPWSLDRERINVDKLREKCGDYTAGQVPSGVRILVAGLDTQDNRVEILVLGIGYGMERWIISRHVVWHEPSTAECWQEVELFLASHFLKNDGSRVPLVAAFIDSGGHFSQDVYNWTRLQEQNNKACMIRAIRGASSYNKPIVAAKPTPTDINLRGKHMGKGKLWIIGTDTAKDWTGARWKVDDGPGAIHLPSDVDDAFLKQLTAEVKVARTIKGKIRHVWDKTNKHEANEIFDCLIYATACAHWLGVHKMHEADLDKFAQKMLEKVQAIDNKAKIYNARNSAASPAPKKPARQQPKLAPDAWLGKI